MAAAGQQAISSFLNQDDLKARRRLQLILSLALVLLTLLLYNPVSHAPFLNYDDNAYVYENFHVREGLNWNTIVWAFKTNAESNWHPVTWLSHCLDVTLFGLNPAGPHYVNVIIHAVNVLLLFLLLEASARLIWRSLAVAALFAVHPLNVESVAWIAERKNLLSMFFFLVALAAYGWYAKKPGIARYLAVALCFALGLMAKPQVITLPFALLLLDYWPLNRVLTAVDGSARPGVWPLPWLIAEQIPLLGLSAASAAITMRVQTSALHLEFPLSVRLENAAVSYVRYVWKTLWPMNLAPLYPHPGFSVSRGQAAEAALALVAITALTLLSRRRYLVVGWLWFLGILVPMIGLVQVGVQAMADRYAYIPAIGLFVMIVWGIAELLETRHVPRIAAAGLCGVAVTALALDTYRYLEYWQSNAALWTHTLQVTQNNFIAEDSLAESLLTQGRADEAVLHFQNAARINPQDPIANLNLGAYEQERGNYPAALSRYQSVLLLTQNTRLRTLAFTNLGYIYYVEGNLDAARQNFASALQLQPENPQALLGLGLIAHVSGNLPVAIDQYGRALRLQASDLGYLLLAQALDQVGREDQAKLARAAAERVSRDISAAARQTQRLLTLPDAPRK